MAPICASWFWVPHVWGQTKPAALVMVAATIPAVLCLGMMVGHHVANRPLGVLSSILGSVAAILYALFITLSLYVGDVDLHPWLSIPAVHGPFCVIGLLVVRVQKQEDRKLEARYKDRQEEQEQNADDTE